jgi:hypothetical protein
MKKIGSAVLPLHDGYAPRWLFKQMMSLASEIVSVIVDEFGRDELLRRLSDPFWFQSLGCVLGFDWHSSGVTTVLTGVLREVLDPKVIGIAVCGGKGKRSTRGPQEIHEYGSLFRLSDEQIQQLEYASRIVAKVDNAAIQAGYTLYHHSFFMTVDGRWSVVQQGMSMMDKTARRYHWLSDRLESYVDEPHEAIVGDVVRRLALDMTSRESEGCRTVSLDLVKEGVRRVRNDLLSLRPKHQRALTDWMQSVPEGGNTLRELNMPRNINWDAIRRAYEFQPKNYEELISVNGIGPGAVRALALISELIYGTKPSWKDPVKYSFAVGGKDGIPFPVNRESYDEAIQFLRSLIEKAKLGKERYRVLQRLQSLTPRQTACTL